MNDLMEAVHAGVRRIKIAGKLGLENADVVAAAAVAENVPYAVACALVMQESGGKNIYGHDKGGVFSTRDGDQTICGVTYPKGVNVPVDPINAGLFLLRVGNGQPSNGIGLTQVTWAGQLPDGRASGYFRLMLDEGLAPWVPLDNARFGLRLLKQNLDRVGDWPTAFGHYNGGTNPNMTYAAEAMAHLETFRKGFRA